MANGGYIHILDNRGTNKTPEQFLRLRRFEKQIIEICKRDTFKVIK